MADKALPADALFIALIVNSMHMLSAETSEEIHETADIAHVEREELAKKIDELASEIKKLRGENTN